MPSSRGRDRWIGALLPGEEPTLDFIPMAARRALDRGGRKLSLTAWRAMGEEARAQLIAAGAAPRVDVEAVRALAIGAPPIEATPDVDPARPPSPLIGRITEERWRALGPVARHALESYARRGREARVAELLAALG